MNKKDLKTGIKEIVTGVGFYKKEANIFRKDAKKQFKKVNILITELKASQEERIKAEKLHGKTILELVEKNKLLASALLGISQSVNEETLTYEEVKELINNALKSISNEK